MPQTITIDQTRETPKIALNNEAGTIKIEGRSLPENATDFYNPIIDWIKTYSEQPQKETTLEIFLEYLNSGSLKQVFKIMYMLEDINTAEHQSKIVWYYKKNDELMFQKGTEFKEFLDIAVNLEEV